MTRHAALPNFRIPPGGPWQSVAKPTLTRTQLEFQRTSNTISTYQPDRRKKITTDGRRTERQTDTQTDRQRGSTQTDRQTDRQRDRQAVIAVAVPILVAIRIVIIDVFTKVVVPVVFVFVFAVVVVVVVVVIIVVVVDLLVASVQGKFIRMDDRIDGVRWVNNREGDWLEPEKKNLSLETPLSP